MTQQASELDAAVARYDKACSLLSEMEPTSGAWQALVAKIEELEKDVIEHAATQDRALRQVGWNATPWLFVCAFWVAAYIFFAAVRSRS